MTSLSGDTVIQEPMSIDSQGIHIWIMIFWVSIKMIAPVSLNTGNTDTLTPEHGEL